MWILGRGAGEGEENEKCGAGQELCLLQRKGLCCHGIFILLWEMKECDTPIKSAIARQDGQPDPAGRAATSLVSPGLGHSTAGGPATSAFPPPPTSSLDSHSPAEGGRVPQATDLPALWQMDHLVAAVPAVPQFQHVVSARERGQGYAARPLWPSAASSGRWNAMSPKQSLLPSQPGPPHPRQAATGRVCRAVPEPC